MNEQNIIFVVASLVLFPLIFLHSCTYEKDHLSAAQKLLFEFIFAEVVVDSKQPNEVKCSERSKSQIKINPTQYKLRLDLKVVYLNVNLINTK